MTSFLRRHVREAAIVLVVFAASVAYATMPPVRATAHSAWRSALAWAGIREAPADADKVYWCPMHPQVKSNKENAVCPLCSMALVELEGAVVENSRQLMLTPQQVQQAGVASVPVMRRALYREIDTTGRIDYDERLLAKITSWVGGKSRIDKLHVNYKGIHVHKGEPLAELYSPELIVAQEEYLSALENLSGRTASSFESELLKSARQKLKYQGLTEAQIDKLTETRLPNDRIPIVSPLSGTVHQRNVQEGQYVEEGDVLFEVVDLTRLWVFADIFEEELQLVGLGLPVDITVQYLPDQVFHGEIAFIDHMIKPNTRTVPIRVDVANSDHLLKAGMFARVRLRRDWPSLLTIPENAVLWSGQRAMVIVQAGEGAFQPREVQLGQKWLLAGDSTNSNRPSLGFGDAQVRYHEVLAGLAPGENVVTSGAFLLNAESQFQSVLAKMLPPESQRTTLEQVVSEPVAERIRGLLDAYFELSGALADDAIDQASTRLERVRDEAQALATVAADAGTEDLANDARQFSKLTTELAASPVKDARDARSRFGKLSHEITRLLADHGGQTAFGNEFYQFECGMANIGYERWLWWSPEVHNPYMGRKMLDCGKRLDVLEP